MCDSFYVTLFSNVSSDIYKSNTLAAFTNQLAQVIELHPTDKWEVGLCEFTCSPPAVGTFKPTAIVSKSHGLIYCNLISPQFMGDKSLRCLRTFTYPSLYCQHVFENIYYVPVEKRSFREIRIEALTLEGVRVPFKSSEVPTKVVLHFRGVPSAI
jgi:hypothetical protein